MSRRWLLALPLLLTGACGPTGECNEGEAFCSGNVAVNCVVKDQFWFDDYEYQRRDCGDDACILGKGAYCALEPEPDDECAGAEVYCDGDTEVRCRGGYATGRELCHTCDERSGGCVPRVGGSCSPGGCGSLLQCRDLASCNRPCSCDPGTSCEACAALRSSAGHVAQCVEGWCSWPRYSADSATPDAAAE